MDVITYVLAKKYADQQMKNIPGYLESFRNQLKAIQDIMTLERSDPIIQAGQIDSLGGSVAPGVVGGIVDMNVKGRTGRNLIENGDFSEGTAGWAPTYGVLSVIDNVAIIIGDGSASSIWLENTLHGRETDRSYYGVCLARVRDSTCDTLRIVVAGGGVKSIENPEANRWYVLPAKYTAVSDHNKLIAVQAIYLDAATANGKALEVQEVLTKDLTAEGLTGKTADEVNEMFPDWFDGTKSAGPKRMKVVGKNLFDKSTIVLGGYFSSTGTILSEPDSEYSTQYIKIDNTKNYAWTGSGKRIILMTYDRNKKPIERLVTYGGDTFYDTKKFDDNVEYIRVSSYQYLIALQDFQFEEGTTVTIYETYKESLAYTPEVGRSLPNGVADEIDVNEGIKVKNIEKYVVQSVDINTLITAGTNVDVVYIGLPADSNYLQFTNNDDGMLFLEGYRELIGDSIALWNDVKYIDYFYTREGDINLRLIVPKGHYVDLAAAQADLAGLVVHYQLANPEIIQLDIPPQSLLSFENGTLMQQHIIGEVSFYGSNCPVSDTKYPIEELNFIRKVDQVTGVMTDLDISTAVIAGDGLGFTHPDLAVGDLADWDYYYPPELSTLAELSYTVPLANVKDIARALGTEGEVF